MDDNLTTLDFVLCALPPYMIAIEAHQIESATHIPSNLDKDGIRLSDLLGLTSSAEQTDRYALTSRYALPTIYLSEEASLIQLPIEALYPLPELVSQRHSLNGLAALAQLNANSPMILVIDLQRCAKNLATEEIVN